MRNYSHSYINGQWVTPVNGGKPFEVVNPATEEVTGFVTLCDEADAIRAIEAAHAAFDSFSRTSLDDRLDLLQAIGAGYQTRREEMADAITSDMGAPRHGLSINVQAPIGLWHLATTLELAKTFAFEKQHGTTIIRREPMGVVSMITPWNWPMNQVACKVAPALVAGCTMVLKRRRSCLQKFCMRPGCRPGCSTWCMGWGRNWGRSCLRTRWWIWSR